MELVECDGGWAERGESWWADVAEPDVTTMWAGGCMLPRNDGAGRRDQRFRRAAPLERDVY